MIAMDYDALHLALCEALGIEPGRGSKTAVAEAIGKSRQWYNRILKGGGSLETVLEWCCKAGVRVVVEPQADGSGTMRWEVPIVSGDDD